MSKTKFICASCVLSFAFTNVQAQSFKNEELLKTFSGLLECDGSKNAEVICKENCTGDGIFLNGTCSNQSIWNKCLTICRKDWIEDCLKTATHHNLNGLPQCQ